MTRKLKEWGRRYLPAEAISIIATLFCAFIAHRSGGSLLVVALAGTWGGNLGYYGYIFAVDFSRSRRLHRQQRRPYTWDSCRKDMRSLALEFGFAEVVDSLFLRPAFMFYIPMLTGNLISGVLIAKICGDITFYIPAIIGYELNKRHREKQNTT